MGVYKDKWNGYAGNAWRVRVSYKDWTGKTCQHEKRGFKTKKEAIAYETEFRAKVTKDINIGFGVFIDMYLKDLKPQIKPTTYVTKEAIIDTHIRPYFENKSLSKINSTDIMMWQNELLSKRDEKGKGYSPTFLRTINNQLSAIFNHAVKYYDLTKNPCTSNRKMGKAKAQEMLFWTKDEYLQFSEAMKDKPISYYAFQILYWTGVRCGELLALTREDFDLEKGTMHINKNYQVVKGEEMILTPKSETSNRTIHLPAFLVREMEDYFKGLYKISPRTRLFDISKSYLTHEMDRGCKESGVKRIRLHDLRHSSCALLIHLGFSPVQIAERMGHESSTITERYAHLYPSVQQTMADKLNSAFEEAEEDDSAGK